MRIFFTMLRLTVVLAMTLMFVSSCAPPSLEVFLSPNPSFDNQANTQTTPLQQPTTAPSMVQALPAQAIVAYNVQSGADNLVLQLNESMREAEAFIQSGEARLHENNPLEAVREFERARLLLEQDIDPTLSHIEQQSSIQGGIGILSMSRIQALREQRSTMLARVNQSYDFESLYVRQESLEKFKALRQSNHSMLQPVNLTTNSSSPLLVQPQTRIQPIRGTDFAAVASDDVTRAIEQLHRRSDDFRSCLIRANRYFPEVTSILASQGVPAELAYVALLESGYQPSARSSSGGAGLWQLSKKIARAYGLRVSSSNDERLSPTASTRAFARYIGKLQRRFGSWELAMLGYQMGEKRLQSAIDYAGSYDVQSIMESSSAARNYLATLAASRLIADHPSAYGFDVDLSNMSARYGNQTTTSSSNRATVQAMEPPVATLY